MSTRSSMPGTRRAGTIPTYALRLSLPTLLFAMTAHSETNRTVFDFQNRSEAGRWEIVNDGVMGGVSRSQFSATNGIAVFAGDVSLENNGGFASVRSKPVTIDCAGYDAFLIHVRGDGKRYKFTARTGNEWNSPQYQMIFPTHADNWQEIRLPFDQFKASFRGRALPNEPPLDPSKLVSVGFLIADKQAGPFRLEIRSVRAGKTPGDGE